MTKQTEAMKLALEALEWINRVNAMDYEYQQKARESLNAIYEALAEQPAQQQEPVAWISPKGHIHFDPYLDSVPLYTHPQRTWVGLTDEEVVDLKMIGRDLEFVSMTALRRFARDIAQTLKEKNK